MQHRDRSARLHVRHTLRMAFGAAILCATFTAPSATAETAPEAAAPPYTAAAPAADTPAAPASTPATPATAASTPPAEELICKRVRETGSNISRKVCRTRAQIEAESGAATDVLERSRRGANGGRLGEGG